MRKLLAGYVLGFLLAVCTTAMATWFGDLGIGGKITDDSVLLQSISTTKGAIPCPSMTTAQRTAISGPLEPLCVYDTDLNFYHWYNGSGWSKLGDVTLTGTETLTNKTIDADNNTISNLEHGSEVDNPTSGVHGVTGNVVGTTDIQTLTNKTLTAPAINGSNLNFGTATNTNRLLLPSETTTNLDALTDTAALLAYDTTVGKPVFNAGSGWQEIGAGGGGLDVFFSDDFESNVNSVGAGVDVSGNATLDRSHETTNPLIGSGSLRITKSGTADGDGDYVPIEVYTQNADQGVTLYQVSFFANTSATYEDDDLKIYAHDGTNSYPILPETIKAGNGFYIGTFQGPPGSATLAIRFEVDNTDTNDYTIDIDNFQVSAYEGKSVIDTRGRQYSEAAGNFTVTGTSWTTTRAVAVPYKTKDDIWRMAFNFRGSVPSSSRTSFTMSMSGITAKNTSSFIQSVSGTSSVSTVGHIAFIAPNTNQFTVSHATATTDSYFLSGDIELESKPTWAIDDYPQTLGVDAGNRSITARAHTSNTAVIPTDTVTFIGFNTVDFDEVGGFKNIGASNSTTYTSTTYYLVPQTYKYRVSAQLLFTDDDIDADERLIVRININGSTARQFEAEFGGTISSPRRSVRVDDLIDLTRDDIVSVSVFHSANGDVALTASSVDSWFTVEKSGGSSAIFAGEKIEVIATDTSGTQAVTNGNTITWDTTSKSTHGSVVWNGSVFKAKRSGTLKFMVTAKTGPVTPSTGQSFMIKAIKNGSTIENRGNFDYAQSTTNRIFSSMVFGGIYLVKDETVEFQFEEDIPAVNLSGSAGYNTLHLWMD